MKQSARLKLIVVHYHFRSGGVRTVIESAVPHIVRRLNGGTASVVLATGEAPDDAWLQDFRRSLGPTPVKVVKRPAFGYVSEQRTSAAGVERAVRAGLRALFAGADSDTAMVWAHNPSLGRNLLFTRELVRICEERRILLLAHQHDWWFDRRWQRWPEMRRCGFRTLRAVAGAVFPLRPMFSTPPSTARTP